MIAHPLLPAAEGREALLQSAAAQVQTVFEQVSSWPVTPQLDFDAVAARLGRFDFDQPMGHEEVLESVFEFLREGGMQVGHPRYFGLFNPSPSFQGVLADLLVAAFNPQIGAWHHHPAAVQIERHLVEYFADAFGLPETAYGHFTSGGSEANQAGVMVALTARFPAFARGGLRALSGQPRLFASGESHHSLEKIAHQAGLGRDALVRVPTCGNEGMDVEALAEAVDRSRAAGELPFLVVATAGTTNAGVVDPLGPIAALCAENGLHLHVDAAWGGSAILSQRLGAQLAGIERADSITFDPHKLLSVPMGAGMFLCADRTLLERTFGVDTEYVPESAEAGMDSYRLSAQFSRRFIGLKLFMSLAAAGREGYSRVMERQVDLGRRLAVRLSNDSWEVVSENLALVCFDNPAWADQPVEERAERNEALVQAVVDTGQAWISTTRIEGRPVIRVCITSYRTEEADVDALADLLWDVRENLAAPA